MRRYRAVARRLEELERQAPPIVPEPEPTLEEAIAAQWAWAAEELRRYVARWSGYRNLDPAAAAKMWNWQQRRQQASHGYRDDDLPLAIVRDVDRMVADAAAALRALPFTRPVLDLVPEVRLYLERIGRYAE